MSQPGAGWPEALVPLFERAITVEYTSLTAAGRPITVPITPYLEADGTTLDVSTGLTYPAKAERARRNPKVSLLFADPVGSRLVDPPVVLVQGLATVRDADLDVVVAVSGARPAASGVGRARGYPGAAVRPGTAWEAAAGVARPAWRLARCSPSRLNSPRPA